jgi:hypothetical protein
LRARPGQAKGKAEGLAEGGARGLVKATPETITKRLKIKFSNFAKYNSLCTNLLLIIDRHKLYIIFNYVANCKSLDNFLYINTIR